jgi:hypothetical protein
MKLLCAMMLIGLARLSSAEPLWISWTNNLLTVTSSKLPGGKLEVWYLEAFCRKGAHNQDWNKTTIPHKTILTAAGPGHLQFRTTISDGVLLTHEVRSAEDELDIQFTFTNASQVESEIQWFQPACIRVEAFTGRNQTNYIDRSFIFTKSGLTFLRDTGRTEKAVYRGGQVFIPAGVAPADANPRPLAAAQPVNGLIGCFSRDDKMVLATASERTHELFEGVYVCLHSDPRLDGLKPGETKRMRAKIYLVNNDVPALLKRYARDFPEGK